jgi:hypothetical protein
MHPDHLRALAEERRGRLIAHAERRRLFAHASSPRIVRRRGPRLLPALLARLRRRRERRVPYPAAGRALLLDDGPIAGVVPLWMWREHAAQTRFMSPMHTTPRRGRVGAARAHPPTGTIAHDGTRPAAPSSAGCNS